MAVAWRLLGAFATFCTCARRSDRLMSDSRNGLTRQTLLTTGQAALYCGVSRMTVVRWIDQGLLKSLVTPGGQHRVRLEDFKTFLRSQGWDVLLDEDD